MGGVEGWIGEGWGGWGWGLNGLGGVMRGVVVVRFLEDL